MRSVVKNEDALRYDEPPGWLIPVRHSLGASLMQASRFAEAWRHRKITIIPQGIRMALVLLDCRGLRGFVSEMGLRISWSKEGNCQSVGSMLSHRV